MRDLETLRKAERNILIGVGLVVLLVLIYASTSIGVPPPIKGLPPPAKVFTDPGLIRTYYTLDAPDMDAWYNLDVRLQLGGFKRPRAGYPWMYTKGKGESISLVSGQWNAGLGREGSIDGRFPGKITIVHVVHNDGWKQMWMQYVWNWKARRQMQARYARAP